MKAPPISEGISAAVQHSSAAMDSATMSSEEKGIDALVVIDSALIMLVFFPLRGGVRSYWYLSQMHAALILVCE